MSDHEIQAFGDKRVATTLQNGDILIGALRSGVRHCQLESAVRARPTLHEWCQAIGDAVRHRLKYVETTTSEDRQTTGFCYAGNVAALHANTELQAMLVPPLNRGGTLAPGTRVDAQAQPTAARPFAIDYNTVSDVAAAIVAHLDPGAPSV